MATSTTNTPLRPENCIHKRPTSCRLTATPTCCACQDKRPHSTSYQKYVDGVGFVPWGTRQERYCWPCREFWNARVEVSGMRQADTKIPERPDISSFLGRWYDWQRGYRIITRENGAEERQALIGESLADTAHGYLPRSTEELRNGLRPGQKEIIERGGVVEQIPETERPQVQRVELDSEDEHLFDSSEDENEDEDGSGPTSAPRPEPGPEPEAEPRTEQSRVIPEYMHLTEVGATDRSQSLPVDTSNTQVNATDEQAASAREDIGQMRHLRIAREHYQRVTSLRRELQRMRVGIERVMSGLQSLEIEVPDSQEALEQINRLNGRLSRYREAPLDIPELNNPDYQSPISTMFERAWARHNQVQSDRLHAMTIQDNPPTRDAQGRVLPPPPGNPAAAPEPSSPSSQRDDDREPASQRQLATMDAFASLDAARQRQTEAQFARLSLGPRERAIQALSARIAARRATNEQTTSGLGLDAPERPAAIEDDEAFKIDSRCDVCLQQIATVATFPCGHMIMCSWCADEVIPRHRAARNVPRDLDAKCPQCRKKVRYIYTVRVRTADEKVAVKHVENDD